MMVFSSPPNMMVFSSPSPHLWSRIILVTLKKMVSGVLTVPKDIYWFVERAKPRFWYFAENKMKLYFLLDPGSSYVGMRN